MRSAVYSLVCASGIGYVFGVVFGIRSVEMSQLQGRLWDMLCLTGWMGVTFAILFLPIGLFALATVNALGRMRTRGLSRRTRVWLLSWMVLTGAIAIPFLGYFVISGVEVAKHPGASSAWSLLPWWIVRVVRWSTFSALTGAVAAFAGTWFMMRFFRLDREVSTRARYARLFAGVPLLMALVWIVPPLWIRTTQAGGDGASAAAAPAVAPHAAPPAGPICLVGWDGATWDVARPLLERGVLPNLRSLMERGTSAPLRTFEPTSSPLIWTTIATGRPPGVHGVRAQVENRFIGMRTWFAFPPTMGFDRIFGPIWEQVGLLERAEVTSFARRSRAFWNIASEAGRSVGLVHWRVAWPAERFRGFNVTDRCYPMTMRLAGPDSLLARTYTPEELYRELPGSIEPPVDAALLDSCLVLARARTLELCRRTGLPPELAPVHEVFHMELGLALYRRAPTDLFASYFYEIDGIEHRFWKYRAPRFFFGVSRADVERYGPLIDEMYAFTDALLGEVLAAMPENAIVILLSDHGHGPVFGELRRSGGHPHAPPGILVLAGPGVQPGAVLRSPSVFDVFPTLMYLSGLPTESEARGRVLMEAFTDSLRARLPLEHISSYPPRDVRRQDVNPNPSIERERLRELKRLGYIG